MPTYDGTDRIHIVEILTFPFDSEEVFSRISILGGANLDMPGNGHDMHVEVLQSGHVLGFSMDEDVKFFDRFDDLESKALFFNTFCSYKEYKSSTTGECKPCGTNKFSIQGPYSDRCYDCSDSDKLGYESSAKLATICTIEGTVNTKPSLSPIFIAVVITGLVILLCCCCVCCYALCLKMKRGPGN